MRRQNGDLSVTEEDGASSGLGCRFLLYPQAPYLSGYDKPEPVWISTPPDRLQPGPANRRMYVRDPLLEKEPYEFPYLPPFVGATHPPAEAGPDGHFDQLQPGSRQFIAAHAFASAQRVLDIFESFLGREISWYFADTYERLEIIPWVEWRNAQSGFGFLELGVDRDGNGEASPFALNFDVIAHEVGHAILFSLYGVAESGFGDGDFGAFHEANADLISLISFMHFDSGLDRLLRHCQGNLLVLNELNRIAELTGDRQIRLASNARRLSEVTGEIHDRSRPFTGAVFDTIVDGFHWRLAERGLADEALVEIDIREVDAAQMRSISQFTAEAFRARPYLFKTALIEARDEVALALAQTWPRLDPNALSFMGAADILCDRGAAQSAALAQRFETNFRWREIL
ncbi:hypothetical protein G5V57_11655 [Nordella sp. HKS 07]|uniref:hypothetical protein n=1 Tax=Nordella sp. HKS 07 TaxID=2712222 RepID=UPI0013E12563|nr:hypothetical protein [Nordella sp. HKS 07]QIG48321.1 hypothetical protein G5V57_11655 [Nordella sp. HKS 07]